MFLLHVSTFLQDITQPPGKGEETKYHPTVPPAINFNASNDAESIYKTQSKTKFSLEKHVAKLETREVNDVDFQIV